MKVYLIKEKENNNINDIKLVDERYIVLEILKMIDDGMIDWDIIREYEYDIENLSDIQAIALLEDNGYSVERCTFED